MPNVKFKAQVENTARMVQRQYLKSFSEGFSKTDKIYLSTDSEKKSMCQTG